MEDLTPSSPETPQGGFEGGGPLARLEDLYGLFPRVTSIPTWTPHRFQNSFALNTSSSIFYYYDFTNNAWKSTSSLTQAITDALTGAASPSSTNVFATMADVGANLFGDGSDGSATLDGSNTYSYLSKSSSVYTATRDLYFDSLTINTGVELKNGGYYIFVKNTLTRAGTGKITNNGGDGGAASAGGDGILGAIGLGGAAGAIATSAAGVTLPVPKPGIVGVAGGDGSKNGTAIVGGTSTNGAATTNSVNSSGSSGGAGGDGGSAVGGGNLGGGAGTPGTATAAVSYPHDPFELRNLALWDSGTLKQFQGGAGPTAGGGGGGGGGNVSGGGGGGGGSGASGAPAGFIMVFARYIVAANTNALVQAKGGAGGAGGNGGNGIFAGASNTAGGGGGGGGGGGNGGVLGLIYQTCDQTVTLLVDVAGGALGAKGVKGAPGGAGPSAAVDGTNGTAGAAGLSIIIKV